MLNRISNTNNDDEEWGWEWMNENEEERWMSNERMRMHEQSDNDSGYHRNIIDYNEIIWWDKMRLMRWYDTRWLEMVMERKKGW
jgi:hypothetical protein